VIRVRLDKNQLILPVRVTPRGGKNVLLPYAAEDTELKIKVSAPPEEGKANTAVLELLADVLSIPKSRLEVVAGQQSRHKRVGVALVGSQEGNDIVGRLEHALGLPGQAITIE
jgi:uncharacterized protein